MAAALLATLPSAPTWAQSGENLPTGDVPSVFAPMRIAPEQPPWSAFLFNQDVPGHKSNTALFQKSLATVPIGSTTAYGCDSPTCNVTIVAKPSTDPKYHCDAAVPILLLYKRPAQVITWHLISFDAGFEYRFDKSIRTFAIHGNEDEDDFKPPSREDDKTISTVALHRRRYPFRYDFKIDYKPAGATDSEYKSCGDMDPVIINMGKS